MARGTTVERLTRVALWLGLALAMLAAYNTVFPLRQYRRLTDIPAERDLELDVLVERDLEWMQALIRPGDRQTGLNERPVAEVLEVVTSARHGPTPRLLLRLRARAAFEPGQLPLVLGRYPARLGERVVLQTPRYVVSGHIARLPDDDGAAGAGAAP